MRMPAPGPELLGRAREAARDALGSEPVTTVMAATSGRVTVRASCANRPGVAVKVYRDPDKLQQEVSYSRLARELGLPVPNEFFFTAGPPAVLVTGWIDGESIDRHSATVKDLGRLLAGYYVSRQQPPGAADDWAAQVRARAGIELARVRTMALLSRQ